MDTAARFTLKMTRRGCVAKTESDTDCATASTAAESRRDAQSTHLRRRRLDLFIVVFASSWLRRDARRILLSRVAGCKYTHKKVLYTRETKKKSQNLYKITKMYRFTCKITLLSSHLAFCYLTEHYTQQITNITKKNVKVYSKGFRKNVWVFEEFCLTLQYGRRIIL